ncbi:hypothetical protein MPSEU_001082400 [Mayamaea pseudoterrestris]|nr:hypothetical protein MPSEU_001082400 [Mayamaea pseudoterrestris]
MMPQEPLVIKMKDNFEGHGQMFIATDEIPIPLGNGEAMQYERLTCRSRCFRIARGIARLLVVVLGMGLILLAPIAQGLAKGESNPASILLATSGTYITLAGLFGKWILLFAGVFMIMAAFGFQAYPVVLPTLVLVVMVFSMVYALCWCCDSAHRPADLTPAQGAITSVEMDALYCTENDVNGKIIDKATL